MVMVARGGASDPSDATTAPEGARIEVAFRDALTGAAEGILMIDTAGRILFANPAATVLFGYEREELTGLSVEALLPDRLREIHARHRAEYLAAASPGPIGRDRDLVGRRKDGTVVPVQISLSTMTGEGGRVVVAFITDVTQRQKADREIQAYQERLKRMAFDATLTEERERRRIAVELHDRIGQALALAQIKLAPVRGQLAGEARAGVEGAVELIEEAINDSRVLIFDLSPPILYDLGLEEALAWLAEDVEKRHGLHVEIADDGADKPLDDAAKAVVFRAVRELLVNVLKHARVPAAKVRLRRTDDHLEIDVEDQGIGFDPDVTTDRPSGDGFGLLSVREQITSLGGTREIESAPLKGTVVRIRVPVRARQGSP